MTLPPTNDILKLRINLGFTALLARIAGNIRKELFAVISTQPCFKLEEYIKPITCKAKKAMGSIKNLLLKFI
jgi:hypothetical protein